ncbi:MAG: hypothetical protein JWN43_152 [Gammaproteobacteria bacterium]|nr:hypothetical protein [Gammaproteobacteria bacterium]
MTKITRRQVLAAMSAATAVPAFASMSPAGAAPPGAAMHTGARLRRTAYDFFDSDEAEFIEAACARLIPADARGPGALEAGVPQYLDAQLAGAWGAGERLYRSGPWQPGTQPGVRLAPCRPSDLFRTALRAIRNDLAAARAHGGVAFGDLPAHAQDRYLRSLEAGDADLDGVPSDLFFVMLLTMTVEGFFSSPLDASVRDLVPWRLQGYPGAYAAVPSKWPRGAGSE